MANVIQLPTLPPGQLDPAMAADSTADLFWRLVLAYAVRDEAVSVHYHPWRARPDGEGTLYCVIWDTRVDMAPPEVDAWWIDRLLAGARRLAVTGPLGRLRAWATGGAVGCIRVIAESAASDWCVVVWGRGPLAGVEFFRLSPQPIDAVEGNSGAEPGAAPGRAI
jgi:hypothetical protein